MQSATADRLAVVVVATRVAQSLVHVAVEQTNAVVAVRFACFRAQMVGVLWLAGIVVAGAR